MLDYRKYSEYILEQACHMLAIDSPSGYGKEVTDYLLSQLEELGIPAHKTVKGGVLADFGGKDEKNGILLEAHC